MRDALIWILAAWTAWGVFNLLLVLATELRARQAGVDVYVAGIFRPRVFMSPTLATRLTAREYKAVLAHEHGHIAHGHIWKNLITAIAVPFYRSSCRVVRQECEADLYAARFGLALDLASALRKLSTHPFDLKRAELLEKYYRRDAGVPSVREERTEDHPRGVRAYV